MYSFMSYPQHRLHETSSYNQGLAQNRSFSSQVVIFTTSSYTTAAKRLERPGATETLNILNVYLLLVAFLLIVTR